MANIIECENKMEEMMDENPDSNIDINYIAFDGNFLDFSKK